MKYITFAVPCYNSENYMEHCIETLLAGGEDVEIILINDGSTDKTKEIIDRYAKKYPNIIRSVHKENGGHGSGVNKGLELATGLYYKVVDSDDWVSSSALKKVLKAIKKLESDKTLVDLFIVNYVYENEDSKPRTIKYLKTLPVAKVFDWNMVGKFKIDEYLLMHSIIYKTDFLRDTGLKLPLHTFYVDNLYAYYPMPKVKTMYYLDVDFYRYFIGRSDQSVNEKVMIGRIEQQLFITKTMLEYFNPYDYVKENKRLTKYLIHYLDIMMAVSTILCQVSGTKKNLNYKHDLWKYLKKKNKKLYLTLCFSLSGLTRFPRFISVRVYCIVQKKYKFN